MDKKQNIKMELFRTILEIPVGPQFISYSSKVLFMGSCFAENMGGKLSQYKFQTHINPFGIVYNPQSIVNSLERLSNKEFFVEADLFEEKGVWNSFEHHSRFSDTNKERCIRNINKQLDQGANFLNKADFLIITFGTAWVYELRKTGKVVSNCHKVPANEFKRYHLTMDEMVEKLTIVLNKLKNNNPNLNIILSVSPVRHLHDGLVENQLSKATLLLAAHELAGKVERTYYFPSYEIMMDDLRDYRFYADDMVHPSQLAVEYIWDKFKCSWIDPNEFKLMDEVAKIQQAVSHRPFFPESLSHQKFIKKQLENIRQIEDQQPGIDLRAEKTHFEKLLLE